MSTTKASARWVVNLLSFILLVILAFTGLMDWLVLPKGYQVRGSFLVSLRHFLTDIHEWTALLFIITIAIHIVLHWGYIRAHLRKTGGPS